MVVFDDHLHPGHKDKLQPLGKLQRINAKRLGTLESLFRWWLGLPQPELPQLHLYVQQAIRHLPDRVTGFGHINLASVGERLKLHGFAMQNPEQVFVLASQRVLGRHMNQWLTALMGFFHLHGT